MPFGKAACAFQLRKTPTTPPVLTDWKRSKALPTASTGADPASSASIVFSGDTTYSEKLVALADGADVFVCEVLEPVAMRRAFDALVAGGAFAGAEEGVWRHMVDTHATPEQVGRMAAQAGVGRVVLTHLAPGALLNVPDSTYTAGVAEHFGGPVLVAEDGMVVPI